MSESALQAREDETRQSGHGYSGCWHATAKGFIRALLIPDPSRRLTAEQALTHSWLTSFAAPTEHDRSAREL
jgi:hypothetical protein